MHKPYFEKPPEMSGQKSAVLTKEKALSSADLPDNKMLSSA